MLKLSWLLSVSCIVFALEAPAVLGQNSNLDLAQVVSSVSSVTGLSIASANGFLYTVGVTNAPASFQTTAGALQVQGSTSMVFAQKLRTDGTVVASALIADAAPGYYAAKVDAAGNIYLAVATNNVAGVTLKGTGATALVKVGPDLDQVLYATYIFDYTTGPMSLAVDSDGSAIAAVVTYDNAELVKLDATGAQSFSYFLTDTPEFGGGTVYDARWIGIAIAPDHSLVIGVSPGFLYHVDAAGKQLLNSTNLNSSQIELSALCLDAAGNTYLAGAAPDPLPASATPVDYVKMVPAAAFSGDEGRSGWEQSVYGGARDCERNGVDKRW